MPCFSTSCNELCPFFLPDNFCHFPMGYITLINNTICQFCQDLKQVLHFHFAHFTFTVSQPICACVTLIIFLLSSYPMVFAEFHPVPSAVQI